MINVALFGFGRIGQMHAKNLIKNMGLNLKGLNQVQKAMRTAEREGLSELDSSVIHTILEKTYK